MNRGCKALMVHRDNLHNHIEEAIQKPEYFRLALIVATWGEEVSEHGCFWLAPIGRRSPTRVTVAGLPLENSFHPARTIFARKPNR